MRKITFTFIVLFACLNINATNWMTSFEEAQKIAIATNKLILVDFWATWCRPCLMMESDTWNKEEISTMMTNFIPLKIDIDSNRSLASRYSANRIPYVIIIDANGEIIYESTGYKDKNKMLSILKKYSVDMSGFQEDFLRFRKEKSSDDAMNIAEKYFDYSIYVNESVKSNFLKMANIYLKKAKKLSNKSEYKEKFKQKTDLLSDVYRKLILGKYEKVIKILNKEFNEENIQDENKGFYSFLYFTAYQKLNDKPNTKMWYDKLKTDKNSKIYLLKSRKI